MNRSKRPTEFELLQDFHIEQYRFVKVTSPVHEPVADTLNMQASLPDGLKSKSRCLTMICHRNDMLLSIEPKARLNGRGH